MNGVTLRSVKGTPLSHPEVDANFKQLLSINALVVESHAANAVTYTLLGRGALNLSASNPLLLRFPSATLKSGELDDVFLEQNISVTLRAGDTTGHVSGRDQHHFLGLMKTVAGPELFVTNLPPDYPGVFLGKRLISSTQITGGALVSPTAIYSTAARAGVPWIPLAKVLTNQVAAGNWAADPVQLDMWPYVLPSASFQAQNNGAAQAINTSAVTVIQFPNEVFDDDGAFDNATYRFQPKVAGDYLVCLMGGYGQAIGGGQHAQWHLRKNGAETHGLILSGTDSAVGEQFAGGALSHVMRFNGTTDYADFTAYHEHGSARNLFNSTRLTCSAARISGK